MLEYIHICIFILYLREFKLECILECTLEYIEIYTNTHRLHC